MRILITGGAGFVGSSLARAFRQKLPNTEIIAFDNLKRRGSELNLPFFKTNGIKFYHGDIRNPSDLEDMPGNFDLLIEASAEPSVLAGLSGTPQYVLQTNLTGTQNSLEFARNRAGLFVFLSTSRVYSILPLRNLNLETSPSGRFLLTEKQKVPGVSKERGITEDFPTSTARSLYGATKLASEILIQEYNETYKLKALINRCGVIAGPGQFGKVDQGVFTLWVANHYFKQPLSYTGFGGMGYQVRDLLHPLDLFNLLEMQIEKGTHEAEIYNVGGGMETSTSLYELTKHCEKVTGNHINISSRPETNPVDIPYYVSDCTKVNDKFGWRAKTKVHDIVQDIYKWIRNNEETLRPIFCNGKELNS